MGTQKNHLTETVLLSTPKKLNNDGKENIHNFMLKFFDYMYLDLCFFIAYISELF